MTFFDGTTNLLTLDCPFTVALINDVREQIRVGRLVPDPVPGDATGYYRSSEELVRLIEYLHIDLKVSVIKLYDLFLLFFPTLLRFYEEIVFLLEMSRTIDSNSTPARRNITSGTLYRQSIANKWFA